MYLYPARIDSAKIITLNGHGGYRKMRASIGFKNCLTTFITVCYPGSGEKHLGAPLFEMEEFPYTRGEEVGEKVAHQGWLTKTKEV